MANKRKSALDRADEKNAMRGQEPPPFERPRGDLQKIFLGPGPATLLQAGSTALLTGPDAVDLVGVLPFLLFNATLTIQLCPHCPQTKRPETLVPLLDRRLAFVAMIGPFGDAPSGFQDLAERYSELFVGPASYDTYQFYALNPHETHMTEEGHYCERCIKETLQPAIKTVDRWTGAAQKKMLRAARLIQTLYHPVANDFADRFVALAASPNENGIDELERAALLAHHMAASNALGEFPQIPGEMVPAARAVARDLRIDYPQEIHLETYLDILSRYRGALSPAIIPFDASKAVEVARVVNGEVAKIASSKRAVLGSFVGKLIPGVGPVAESVVRGGRYGIEGAQVAAEAVASTSWGKKIWARFLSKCYYRVSPDAVHVWWLQKEIAAARRMTRSESN